MPTPPQPTVAIAGGGLAGLAAACALSNAGFRVTLFEKRPFLGGRASSWEHPGTGEVVDNCQHVLFRVCTNLLEFYDRIGAADQIRWYDEMTFIEPGGARQHYYSLRNGRGRYRIAVFFDDRRILGLRSLRWPER